MIKRGTKRAISPVIATILLIVITLAAIGIIWGGVLPLIRQGIGTKEQACLDADIIIAQDYTCKNSSGASVQIIRGTNDFDLIGLIVSLSSGGNSEQAFIGDIDFELPEIYYEVDYFIDVEVPSLGESKVYNIPGPEEVEVIEVIPVARVGGSVISCNNMKQTLANPISCP